MPYTRTLSTPTVWRRFVAHGSKLRVQDLTPDLHEAAISLLRTYFTRDEPPCKYIGIENHPTAMHELEQLWRKGLRDNVSIVCVVDDDSTASRVVGVNILVVACQEDKDEPFQTDDKIWAKLFGAVDLVARGVDVFKHYGVDKYLTAYGLVVDPEWRGAGVAKEILKARGVDIFKHDGVDKYHTAYGLVVDPEWRRRGLPRRYSKRDRHFLNSCTTDCQFSDFEFILEKNNLCRSLGIKVTATVFTAKASQMAAKKAGFVDLYEITYEELAKKGCVFPGVERDTQSSKLMALVIE